MKITFFSNYLTHHQIPFCEEMQKNSDVEFYFVSTEPMEEERVQGGWELEKEYPFEIKAYLSNEEKEKALKLAVESDVIIHGSAPEEYVKIRMKKAKSKLTFRYSERIYKNGRVRVLSPRGLINRFKTYFRYLGKPLYMLCASAYTAGDLAMLGSYLGKCYKWGYFPKTYRYDVETLLNKKQENSLVWVARFIDWKHPEVPVEVAKALKDKGYKFTLKMIGNGPLINKAQKLIEEYDLTGCVSLIGAMHPEEVRSYMEESKILLFTSDRKEGWGAVINEAMDSACVVVSNQKIGAVPFLVKDGENGCVYNKNDVVEICKKIETLLLDGKKTRTIGANAHRTISEEWSEQVASQRLIEVCKSLKEGKKIFYKSGPMSKAKIRAKR